MTAEARVHEPYGCDRTCRVAAEFGWHTPIPDGEVLAPDLDAWYEEFARQNAALLRRLA